MQGFHARRMEARKAAWWIIISISGHEFGQGLFSISREDQSIGKKFTKGFHLKQVEIDQAEFPVFWSIH